MKVFYWHPPCLFQEKASASRSRCQRRLPKWRRTQGPSRWPSMGHGSHVPKRVSKSNTFSPVVTLPVVHEIYPRPPAATSRGFPENVPIIQRKSLYAVMGSHYWADGARWCSGRRAYRAYACFGLAIHPVGLRGTMLLPTGTRVSARKVIHLA